MLKCLLRQHESLPACLAFVRPGRAFNDKYACLVAFYDAGAHLQLRFVLSHHLLELILGIWEIKVDLIWILGPYAVYVLCKCKVCSLPLGLFVLSGAVLASPMLVFTSLTNS